MIRPRRSKPVLKTGDSSWKCVQMRMQAWNGLLTAHFTSGYVKRTFATAISITSGQFSSVYDAQDLKDHRMPQALLRKPLNAGPKETKLILMRYRRERVEDGYQ